MIRMRSLPGSSHLTTRAIFLFKVVLTLILIAYLVYRLDWRGVVSSLSKSHPILFLLGIILSGVFVGIRIAKWQLLARTNQLIAPHTEVIRLTLLSLVMGMITPARVGELLCVGCFSETERRKGVFLFAFDRYAELCTVLVLSIPGVSICRGGVRHQWASRQSADRG